MNAWAEADGKTLAVSSSSILSPTSDGLRKRPGGPADSYLVSVGSRTARLRRQYKEKICIAFLLLLVFALLVILIIISFYYAVEKKRGVCESRECVRSAANLLLSMDQEADPCEDFYKFACGNWETEHPKPDSLISYNWFLDKQNQVDRMVREILRKNSSEDDPEPLVQAREMYTACTDTETLDSLGLQPIVAYLLEIGLPRLPRFLNLTQSSNTGQFEWVDCIMKIKRITNMDVILGFDIFPGPKNMTLKRLLFGEPSRLEALHSHSDVEKILQTLKQQKSDRIIKTRRSEDDEPIDDEEAEDEESPRKEKLKLLFQEVIKKFVKLAKNDTTIVFNDVSEEDTKKCVNSAIDEYVELGKLIKAIKEDYLNSTANETKSADEEEVLFDLSADDLQNQTNVLLRSSSLPYVQIWKPYLLGVFNGSGVKLDFNKDLVLLNDFDLVYLHAVICIIQSTPPIVVELYIWIKVVESLLPQTTTEIRKLHDTYSSSGTSVALGSGSSRSMRCAISIGSSMGMAVGYAVAKPVFLKTTQPRVEKMLNNIKMGFQDLVVHNNWMDRPTKAASIEKVQKMRSLIGFPEWLLEPGELEEYYLGVTADPKQHMRNQIGLLQLSLSNRLRFFRHPYTFSWETRPTEVNAYHTFFANAITIPLVMLQYPFYDLGLEALNYGSIGTVLGHELTHGFDDFGRRFDKTGSMVQWWSNTTINSFVSKTKCLVKQYSDFYLDEVGKYVNGNLTLGENIADNGGVRSALRGYWKEKASDRALPGLPGLSGDQLFFLSYGNLWCGVHTAESLMYDLEDEHSPNHIRLKAVLQNTPEFARAFGCRSNSSMNPSRPRCVIF